MNRRVDLSRCFTPLVLRSIQRCGYTQECKLAEHLRGGIVVCEPFSEVKAFSVALAAGVGARGITRIRLRTVATLPRSASREALDETASRTGDDPWRLYLQSSGLSSSLQLCNI
jgi:hypothetical protein